MNKILTIINYLLIMKYWKEPINMDKKYIEREKTFNKKEYDKEYRKKNYRQFNTNISIQLNEQIVNYCNDNGISKADFLRLAVDKIINNI